MTKSILGFKNAPGTIEYEIEWMTRWPMFEERPATLREFLGEKYLNIEDFVRPSVRDHLAEIFGPEVSGDRLVAYELAMITGGIGIGKTTIASIVLPYLAHWVLCLKNPQGYFGLLPGSRIAFMQMSTSGDQAKEVVFGDIKARIDHSPWFQAHGGQRRPNPRFKSQIRWESKDIWILPGDSRETTFEGYNILGGILDEADSHLITKNKDYAQQGYDTIYSRVTSRFEKRGFVLVIGQMKKSNGFAAKKFREFTADPRAYAVRFSIWESRGDKFYADQSPDGICHKFLYDPLKKQIVPPAAKLIHGKSLLEIPEVYRRDFTNNPEKALRDLAGIPPSVSDPFISMTDRIYSCRTRWMQRYPSFPSPFNQMFQIAEWFIAPDTLPRAIHIDLGSIHAGDNTDALAIAMGHVPHMVEIEGELKPYIVFDLLARWTTAPGQALMLSDMRRFVYDLNQKRKFRIEDITLDGFQSQDTIQQFQKKRFNAEELSVDRKRMPYEDLREAIYDERVEFPPLMVRYHHMDSVAELVEIAVKELLELRDLGNKVDHPDEGSKDVADAMAGVCYTLMGKGVGERTYKRRATKQDMGAMHTPPSRPEMGGISHPAYNGDAGLRAPVPPTMGNPYGGPR